MRNSAASLDPTPFGGRYTLLRRLAVGGMAEIYLARQAAMAGFEKEVVIKRLRAELADDNRIVEMFLDEARIGALLNHPNIVHVYDVDEHDGIPYIAMEYIVGEELNELCRRGLTHGRFLPLEHAVELIRQGAAGMGYFHAKRGAEGTALAERPLEIVHCDISPSNLLVTEDGFLKVIDFGIARAQGQRQRGENVIPGKLSYMSPEQASRQPIDHRSDVYSLGIVLYEITVGKRLFRGPASEVVKKLTDGVIEPPTFARRNFPPALESIVMRALEKHPDDRYQTAYDLADDLESFLRDERLHSGPVRIARYLDMLAQADGGKRRPELISEGEAHRAGGDDLDFDSQVFDGYAPSEGAPGPEQAPEWEDPEQPDADVAAALGMELTELRAMRTPVPGRDPSEPLKAAEPKRRTSQPGDDDFESVTNPIALIDDSELGVGKGKPRQVRAIGTDVGVHGAATVDGRGLSPTGSAAEWRRGPLDGDSGDADAGDGDDVDVDAHDVDIDAADADGAAHAEGARAPARQDSMSERAPTTTYPLRSCPALVSVSARFPAVMPPDERATPAPAPVSPAIGAAMVARSAPSRLPWVLVVMLAMAVASLAAYIFLK